MLRIWTSHVYSVADNVRCVIGEQVYKLSRDEVKEMVGANIGIRLFSQLQRDRARVSPAKIPGYTAIYQWP